jgi:aldose 1-epimerase
MTTAPSGEQYEITDGEQRATIVEVGGGVREYVVAGRPVLDPYPLDAMADGAHGAPLIPWPNRLGDGRYRFDDVEYQLPLSEPTKHNAIHGLLRWRPWRAVEQAPNRVVMGARLHPQAGYPFMLDVRIDYELGPAGLTVSTTTVNGGDRACPYGTGQHPYLSPGSGLIDECTLELPGQMWIVADDERQFPVGSEPVRGGALDFTVPRRLGGQVIDCAFTDLIRDAEDRAVTRLAARDRRTVELWADNSYGVLQVYTGDTLSPRRRRRGLAVEPMTCPANAFQTGQGLIRLEPGESVTSRWGVRLI